MSRRIELPLIADGTWRNAPGDARSARAQPRYWRSLEELHARSAAGPQPEFHEHADRPPGELGRRSFLQLLGASMALAGVTGCVESPSDRILPYVRRPPELVPGTPYSYATVMVLDGYATGVLVQTREGRPIKVEGNPDHPASLGAAGVYEQGSLLQLYDPFRLRGIRQRNVTRSWDDVLRAFGPGAITDDGAGLHFLLEPTSSPFRVHWIEAVHRRYPAARFHYHAPTTERAAYEATTRVFGRPLTPVHDYGRAGVVVSLERDFTAEGPFHLRYAHDFADARRIRRPTDEMNRLYVAEPMPSPTGSVADHPLPVRSSDIGAIAAAILAEVDGYRPGRAPLLDARMRAWLDAVVDDLRAHAGESLVVAGRHQPAAVHALVYLANQALGNTGRTEQFVEPAIHEAGAPSHDLRMLVDAIAAGTVHTLAILGGNPVYAAPGDLELGDAVRDVPRTLYLGAYENETAATCEWLVPEAQWLESWGDARALDGTLSLAQPLIRPLFGGRTVDELLMAVAGAGNRRLLPELRERWHAEVHSRYGDGTDFHTFWDSTLRLGIAVGSRAPAVTVTSTAGAAEWAIAAAAAERASEPDRVEVTFRPDPSVYDGRFSNNVWLLELPDPVTKLTWENAALMSPALAERLGVDGGDFVRIEDGPRAVELPVLPVPGHADHAVTLRLGYGREGGEETARGYGVNVYPLCPPDASARISALVTRLLDADGAPRHRRLATTQTHWSMEGREIVLEATLAEYRRDPNFTQRHKGPVESLYHGPSLDAPEQWAMTIDLSVCTGCSACVVACQAENNIPVVGREGVLDRREMHWLRLDRYLTGDPAEPHVVHQPMLCQHCESAPCEYVCPVNATVHSEDGLNEMIYNRCIGTRFCSNNCPYKVRRFNWFDYNAARGEVDSLVFNPDVTVRERGVMEKCTYCVQRIRRANRAATVEGRAIRPGEVQTACQQACPTQAIVFGSLNEPDGELAATREQDRLYSVLHELGTEPRTQYLARINNPNAALSEPRPSRERPL